MSAESNVEEIINKNHGGDKKQLEIIFSPKNRIAVEAPAGCGKTTTMVSKVAYLIAKKEVLKNKKMLALTFSVNAAYKMKKDLSEKLPKFGLNQINNPEDLNQLIYISNYHGLCRRIITLYGYLFDERLKDINNFKAINENDYKASETFEEYGLEISEEEKVFFSEFNYAVLNCEKDTVETLEEQYCEILKDKFFELRCITYNGYLLLAKWILSNNTELLRFYQQLYPLIIIDEFQDTNFLSWNLMCTLINDETKLFFMGDSLQRIYGFIGAIPNILEKAQFKFGMDKIEMVKNYRFENNTDMLLLDKNIRENAKNMIVPKIANDAKINLHFTKTQEEESQWVVDKISEIQQMDNTKTTAILVQQRGNGIETIIQYLNTNNIKFFYALFSDEDDDYIRFHRKALATFYQVLDDSRYGRVNRTLLKRVEMQLKKYYNKPNRLTEALLMLVNVFFDRVCTEYRFLENQDKIAFISDTFENRALKQNMDLIDSNLFISTVHGAKGLEWDYVFIPDLEPFCFPNYPSLCGECCDNRAGFTNVNYCKLDASKIKEKSLLEELSVFYVAVTRVRNDLFFSASGNRKNANGKICNSKISCLAFLPGIKIKNI